MKYEEDVDAPRERVTPPKLPPTPASSKLLDVLPYLVKLAVSDRQLWWRLGASVALMLLSKSSGLMAPIFLKNAVDALGSVVNESAVTRTVHALLLSGACRILCSLTKEMQGPCFTPIAQAAGRRVAYHTFSHVLDLDINFHLERRTGALSRILERGTRSVSMVFRAVVFTFLPTAIELVLVCGLLARTFTPIVSALVVGTFAAYVGWTAALTRAAAEARKQVNKLDNLTTSKAIDALLNYETVKLFNNEQLEVDEYDRYLVGYQQASVATETIAAVLNGGQGFVLAAGLTAVLASATLSTAVGSFTGGDLVMAQGLLLQLWGPLQFLGWFYRELRQSLVDMEAFFKILATQPNLPDGEASTSGQDQGVAVELDNVVFGYRMGRPVLKGVSLRVEPGESCAIVGSSGSGKSTLLRLLVRLYDAQSGSVQLDGIDVRELQQSSLRGAVAVVPQDTVLFADTILRNIRYGRPDATFQEIERAAEMAQLKRVIDGMPDGYNTIVGERGLKLSGGEKQRVAIARAFLRGPRLLICDEATSALDTATERSIMASLEELAVGRTSVFVAHRLSTVQRCDKIVVMADGQVVEQGTHEELMRAGQVHRNQALKPVCRNSLLMKHESGAQATQTG
ncbi:ABC family transporter: mitochondrial ATM1-like protein [Coccomyxa subellipsoidea C-169]|uniref:ABC family transporter: mitochondrial ATM1-like protein n=1 Tax=Coccomyxa subellipsoidea (strain C-169) TaxID=574566 RepID=I0YYK1_COCSC|nr:ABC family transporter: mitochondrial ATM1-like protein [Coccomyxa subellipsoidea C-169]EIE23470.1 ABC family transporter: mitochondrial ATM1-like protein [Coccomyxa subellipsoidea C-169]|eukprot:XP_005648014.1 ABC family transporter: mitochondrial ATM1-like protein [Coccomyxa subellipsoidea C-169]